MSKVQSVFWRVTSESEEGVISTGGGYISVGGYQFLWRSAFRSQGGSLAHPE